MTLTLDQFGNLGLSQAQKAKIQAAIDIGNAMTRQVNDDIDVTSITPTQAKAIENFIRDVNTLLDPAWRAVRYIRKKIRDDAAKVADDAVAGGQL